MVPASAKHISENMTFADTEVVWLAHHVFAVVAFQRLAASFIAVRAFTCGVTLPYAYVKEFVVKWQNGENLTYAWLLAGGDEIVVIPPSSTMDKANASRLHLVFCGLPWRKGLPWDWGGEGACHLVSSRLWVWAKLPPALAASFTLPAPCRRRRWSCQPAGEFAVQCLPNGGSVVELRGIGSDQPQIDRDQGFPDAIAATPPRARIQARETTYARPTARQTTAPTTHHQDSHPQSVWPS